MLTASIRNWAFVNYTKILNAIKAIEAIRAKPDYSSLRIAHGKDRCANPPGSGLPEGQSVIPGTFWSRVSATFLKWLSAKNLISDKSVTHHIVTGPHGWAQAYLAWPLLNRRSFFLTGGLYRHSKTPIINFRPYASRDRAVEPV